MSCLAVITAVLVDSWLHATIDATATQHQSQWEDWFTWQEEGVDWRREGAGEEDGEEDDWDWDSEEEDDDEDDEADIPSVRLVFKSTPGIVFKKSRSRVPASPAAPATDEGAAPATDEGAARADDEGAARADDEEPPAKRLTVGTSADDAREGEPEQSEAQAD